MTHSKILRIFIGYDSKEVPAFYNLANSIITNASRPVSIIPLKRNLMPPEYTRARGDLDSTEFSITRFLVPYLCDYQGMALFMDCDMLVLTDIYKIFDDMETGKDFAVWVVKQKHEPKSHEKMLGQRQTNYDMKNWSSVMMFDCSRCTALDLNTVNTEGGLYLHKFQWLGRSANDRIGDIDLRWNVLVDDSRKDDWYFDPHGNLSCRSIGNETPALVHFTTGGPWWRRYRNVPYAREWFAYAGIMTADTIEAGRDGELWHGIDESSG